MASVRRPTQVKIGHNLFEIRYVSDRGWKKEHDPDSAGWSYWAQSRIDVRTEGDDGPYSESVVREILFHEMTHMCYDFAGLNDRPPGGKTMEEQIVATLSRAMLGVMRDHPKVMAYLLLDS